MQWSRVEPEARAMAALGLAIPFFVVVFLLAPADNLLRILFLSFLAGGLAAAACWQHFPGWDLFVAGCAFLVGGWFHSLPVGATWGDQAVLLVPAAAAWYAGARMSELLLVFPLGYEYRAPLRNWGRLREELGPGSAVLGIHAAATALVLGALLPAAQLVAFPLGLAVSLAVGLRLPVRRTLWPVLGALLGLWLAGFLGDALDRLVGVTRVSLPDPWLVGGLLTVGVLLGLWGSRWYRGEPKGPKPLKPSGAAPPPPPSPRPEAPPPRGAETKG